MFIHFNTEAKEGRERGLRNSMLYIHSTFYSESTCRKPQARLEY